MDVITEESSSKNELPDHKANYPGPDVCQPVSLEVPIPPSKGSTSKRSLTGQGAFRRLSMLGGYLLPKPTITDEEVDE